MLEFIFLFLLAASIAVFIWYHSFQEFTILQMDYTLGSKLPAEKSPIVIRGLPQEYIRFWSSDYAKQSVLPILTGTKQRTTLREYASSNMPPYHSLTAIELAARFHIHTKFLDYVASNISGIKAWWHLPVSKITSPARLWLLHGTHVLPLQRSLAERTVLTVHEGAAVIWLARETLATKDIQLLLRKNPWALRISEIPFLGDIQFIEVVVRAHNSLILPPRALYGIRQLNEEASTYISSIEIHSPLSLFIYSLSSSTAV